MPGAIFQTERGIFVKNTSIIAVTDNTEAATVHIDSILFLVRELFSGYFSSTAPTADHFSKIEGDYGKIQQLLVIAEIVGEKALDDMRETTNILTHYRAK